MQSKTGKGCVWRAHKKLGAGEQIMDMELCLLNTCMQLLYTEDGEANEPVRFLLLHCTQSEISSRDISSSWTSDTWGGALTCGSMFGNKEL
jgi:hypothetical protein